jgi:hypothetical protein
MARRLPIVKKPPHRMTDYEIRASVNEFTQDDPPPYDRPGKPCEFGCGRAATVYGGYAGAGDWAGRACDEHAKLPGFQVWDRL